MDLEHFLSRVVAEGNYLALVYKFPDRGMTPRFFQRANSKRAASYAAWASSKGADVWYAVASFNQAELRRNNQGDEFYVGPRTQANAQKLKAFWFDADIKRDGDGKDPAKVFGSAYEVVQWAKGFTKATGIPLPNLWVCSGYGVHLYWLVEDALDRAAWEPYAQAMKAALAANGGKGDLSVVADASRILRPIDTFNYKVPSQPAPCYVLDDRLVRPDYPNAAFLATLQTFVPTVGNLGNLGNLGVLPARQGPTPMADAARMPAAPARPRDFALIASGCGQVQASLDEGGARDQRQMWHSLVTLAWFSEDGRRWAHQISSQHPKYTPASTDAEFDQVEADHTRKPFGPPLCKTLDAERSGICAHCPSAGRVTTPYQLGLLVVPDELPAGYQRDAGWIHRVVRGKDGEASWSRLIEGDFCNPKLERVDKHYRLCFDYVYNGHTCEIAIENPEIAPDLGRLKATLALRGLPSNFDNTRDVGKLLMAWIEKLRGEQNIGKPLPAFGWAKDANSKIIGFAVGGSCYTANGITIEAHGCDREIVRRYTAQGDMARWKQAVDPAIKDEPVLQVAAATSFGAPLMEFTGESGLCLNIWSSASGTGKSSALRLGASVWGDPRQNIFQLDDTDNTVAKVMSTTNTMPSYWDEILLSDDRAALVKNLVYKITQGRDKGRMAADTSLRHPGVWKTIMLMATNRSVKHFITADRDADSADPTSLRVLDMEHTRASKQIAAGAARALSALDDHYGWAGVEYARYLATNAPGISVNVAKVLQLIQSRTQAGAAERFYVAGAAATLVGASIAKELGLVDFDTRAILDTLCAAIVNSRPEAVEAVPLSTADLVNQFVSDFKDESVVTKRFKPPGPRTDEKLEVVPINPYHKRPYPAYQIAMREQKLRVDKEAFKEWWGANGKKYHGGGYTARQMFKLIREDLGGTMGLAAIGAGTNFSVPRVFTIDISLARPELSHWIDAYTDDSKVVRLRPKLPTPPAAAPPSAAP